MNAQKNATLLQESRADLQGGDAVNQAHDVHAHSGEELQLHVWLQPLHNHAFVKCSSTYESV